MRRYPLHTAFAIATLACAVHVHAAEAGKVIYVAGAGQVAQKAAAEGMPVQEGDLLTTGADGYIYIRTPDKGLLILRPNTKARIAAYHIDSANPANSRFKIELLSGVARSTSGEAVKLARQNFRFNTPVAAIGVRGTDFTVFHDHDVSRVTVMTGGIVMSGFGGACSPEGRGPCEGAASRELSAAQRGQLLQVKRGETAPQLLTGSASPDQVSPARADEPLAKGAAPEPVLDAKKSESVVQIPALPPTPVTPPPVVVTPPPVLVDPTPQPPVVQRGLDWGRWQPLLGDATTAPFDKADAERILGQNFVLYRSTVGQEYVAPERGSVGFSLKDGQAYIVSEDPFKPSTAAQLQNGQMTVDFGKRSFTTTVDLVSGSETFKLMADGDVTSDGRFGNTAFVRPQTNNMSVDGFLSNANGGSAGYIFRTRIDETRSANGVTYWTRQP